MSSSHNKSEDISGNGMDAMKSRTCCSLTCSSGDIDLVLRNALGNALRVGLGRLDEVGRPAIAAECSGWMIRTKSADLFVNNLLARILVNST